MAAILGFPILYSIFMSFQEYTLETLISKQTHFIGFQNYLEVISDSSFRIALTHSLIFTVFSILFQFLIGLALAIVFSKAFPLSHVMRGFAAVGWQFSSSGWDFSWITIDYGLVNFS
jgi:multiple sugar transport system permease protein